MIAISSRVLSLWGILRIVVWVPLRDCSLRTITNCSCPPRPTNPRKHLNTSILKRAQPTMPTPSSNKTSKTSRKYWNSLKAKLTSTPASRLLTTNNPCKDRLKMEASWKRSQSILNNSKLDQPFRSRRLVNHSNSQEASMWADTKWILLSTRAVLT